MTTKQIYYLKIVNTVIELTRSEATETIDQMRKDGFTLKVTEDKKVILENKLDVYLCLIEVIEP